MMRRILSLRALLFKGTMVLVLSSPLLESLLDIYEAATLIWSSNCMILLFLISRVSFSLFISDCCCTIVLLHESKAVFWNSASGLSNLMLEPLCLLVVGGKTGCLCRGGLLGGRTLTTSCSVWFCAAVAWSEANIS